MKNQKLHSINLEKLQADYWSKIQKWDELKKQKEADSKKHNGYIDRPHYQYICVKVEEARMECAAIYDFIKNYFIVDKIEVKRGQYKFFHDGYEYTIQKNEREEYFGWKKGATTYWTVECEDVDAPLRGISEDTKSSLIDWVNNRIESRFINDILGPNRRKS